MTAYLDAFVVFLYWVAVGLVAMGVVLVVTCVGMKAREIYERWFPYEYEPVRKCRETQDLHERLTHGVIPRERPHD